MKSSKQNTASSLWNTRSKPYRSPEQVKPMRLPVATRPSSNLPVLSAALLCLALACAPLRASSPTDLADTTVLMQLEARAAHADPREQCFLYTELVQGYTDIAGRQLAAGELEKAGATLKMVEGFANHIHIGLARDTKKLKNAEMAMHTASHHLGQYLHLVSQDDQAIVASTLKQLDKINEELLTQVFAH